MDNLKELNKREKELRQIEKELMFICSNGMIEATDLGWYAQRVDDIKQEIRIIRARMI